jgi:hypothetical protein
MEEKLEIRCLCQADGILMQLDPSQDIFFCPICGNHLIYKVLEDIVKPLMKHGKIVRLLMDQPLTNHTFIALLPALKNQILIKGQE